MAGRLSGILPALLLACALSPERGEAQVIRRVVDSVEFAGRVTFQFRARSDGRVEVAARTLDGSAEVVSPPIAPDSAEDWTSALSELAGNSSRGGSKQLVLQEALLAARSDSAPNAFTLFLSDTAFTQIGVTVTRAEIRRFVDLLNSASSVASNLPPAEFAEHAPLRITGVVPVGTTQQVPYPKALRGTRTFGEVRARFVVDSLGRVRPGTFKVLFSTHPDFSEAVRSGSRRFRFIPATLNGTSISRTVLQSFIFNVSL